MISHSIQGVWKSCGWGQINLWDKAIGKSSGYMCNVCHGVSMLCLIQAGFLEQKETSRAVSSEATGVRGQQLYQSTCENSTNDWSRVSSSLLPTPTFLHSVASLLSQGTWKLSGGTLPHHSSIHTCTSFYYSPFPSRLCSLPPIHYSSPITC